MNETTKIRFSKELAYFLGILTMAIGVAAVSESNFGYSMIVAPVYLCYKKLSPLFSFLTFGTTEYLFQGCLLILMCLIVRRFRIQYLFSFVTAVLYGYCFDLMLFLVGLLQITTFPARIAAFLVGTAFISISVALFMRTYLAPEVYELFVREITELYQKPFVRVKLTYDTISCIFSIVLSVFLFGGGVFSHFSLSAFGKAVADGYVLEGIGIGTVIAAFVNGPCIGFCGRWMDSHFTYTENEKLAHFLK